MAITRNQNLIVSIDPSYSRTGVFVSTPNFNEWGKFSIDKDKRSAYEITECFSTAQDIAHTIADKVLKQSPISVCFVIEYPVMASRSGSYLGIITTTLNLILRSSFKHLPARFIYIPPMAIASYTKTSGVSGAKTKIVQLCQSDLGVRLNHDEASAYFLYKIYMDIVHLKYKNSYKVG